MEKLYEIAKKELQEIEEQGLNSGNLEFASKLVEMMKDLKEIDSDKEGGEMRRYRDYDGYMDDGYPRPYRDEESYGRRGVPGTGRYRNRDDRDYRDYRDGGYGNHGKFDDILDRLEECVEEYEYARGRYRDGGSEGRMAEGLEKLMYSICMFVESAMNFAESPQEKEIIRKHVQKLQSI